MVLSAFLDERGNSLDKRHKRNVSCLSTLPMRFCAVPVFDKIQCSGATGERLVRKVNLEWARQF